LCKLTLHHLLPSMWRHLFYTLWDQIFSRSKLWTKEADKHNISNVRSMKKIPKCIPINQRLVALEDTSTTTKAIATRTELFSITDYQIDQKTGMGYLNNCTPFLRAYKKNAFLANNWPASRGATKINAL